MVPCFSKLHSNCFVKRLMFTQNAVTQKITNVYESKSGCGVPLAYTSYETTKPAIKSDIPIIILHGFLGSKTNWNTMARQLAIKTLRKVVALDARNHGDSPQTKEHNYGCMVEDIKLIMSELRVKEASLLGHSMGGRTMMAMALTYPELVKDIVIVEISPVHMSDSIHYLPRILKAMKDVRISEDITLHKAREEADEQLKLSVRNEDLRRFLLMNVAFDDKINRFYWKINIQTLDENFQSLLDFPRFENKLQKPALFIGGSSSDFLIKEDEPKIVKLFPMAKFVYIQDAGHLVHAQKPVEFLEKVSKFFNV